MTVRAKPTLGSLMRGLRARYGLTLKEMSARTGVPFSTLSKVEHDRLTLTFDKLQMISERLGVRMSELFAEPKTELSVANGRRSVGTLGAALSVTTPNYDYHYLSPELRQKDMIPIFTRVKARSLEEFGDMVRHDGQEFIYVLAGEIAVHTEFYAPVILSAGESVYIDSRMGHAYLASGEEEALVICVCSTTQEELLQNAAIQALQVMPPPAPAKRPARPGGSAGQPHAKRLSAGHSKTGQSKTANRGARSRRPG